MDEATTSDGSLIVMGDSPTLIIEASDPGNLFQGTSINPFGSLTAGDLWVDVTLKVAQA